MERKGGARKIVGTADTKGEKWGKVKGKLSCTQRKPFFFGL